MSAAGRFRRALILANFEKPAVRELASELEPWLSQRVEAVALEPDIREFCARRETLSPEARAGDRPDLAVVLGGDGALLGAVRAFSSEAVPTLGINLGRVGFLASTPAPRWRETLEGVLEGQGILEPRMRLSASWTARDGREVRSVALNDVTLQRSSRQGMVTAALRLGSDPVTSYRADGVIVATPSGSTAYSLSAGGPILIPPVEAFVVTPIGSQGLSDRPIVLSAAGELTLEVVGAGGVTTLAIDGQAFHSFEVGQQVRLVRHPEPYPLFAMPGLDPFRRLRDRLGWGVGAGREAQADG